MVYATDLNTDDLPSKRERVGWYEISSLFNTNFFSCLFLAFLTYFQNELILGNLNDRR